MADSSKKSNHVIYIVIYRPLEKDRYMAPDIENITKLLREEKVSEFHFVSSSAEIITVKHTLVRVK